ncbi:MAG: ribosomal RNA small subunit methyltransferase A [Spartobacteria bacterium]|nr:ribosomal RNA small subunit methyltransferase A [Spartobacteria bacterium]
MTEPKLISPVAVRSLLEKMDFSPSKVLGQNFLIDGNVRDAIVRAACADSSRPVLEIGPGLGVLTEALVEKTHVVAIEKDERLAQRLINGMAADSSRLRIIIGDALDLDLGAFMQENGISSLVSNLPYAVGNRILVDVAMNDYPLQRMVVMVQKDVADRIRSKPDTKDFGLLSVFCNLNYDVKVIMDVSPNCFVPKPRIWSTVLSFERKAACPDPGNTRFFMRLLHHCFEQRRKQMAGLLSRSWLAMDRAEVEKQLTAMQLRADARPENLSLTHWVALSNILYSQTR